MGIKKNLDQLVQLLKLPPFSELEESNLDYIGEVGISAYAEAKKEGYTEKKAEAVREKAEQAAGDELYKNWYRAVEVAVDTLFGYHLLAVVPSSVKSREPHYEFEIVPSKGRSWEDAARKIVNTIDGVGLVSVSPDDLDPARKFVAGHLAWIRSYPEVYGTKSARRLYEDAWK